MHPVTHATARSLPRALSIALLAALAMGCSREPEPIVQVEGAASGTATAEAILRGKDIDLKASRHPRARITAAGDLTIDDRPIDVTPEQRALLLAYRGQVEAIAQTGVGLGKEGAAFGVRTATNAIRAAVFGNDEVTQSRIEADAARFKERALAICDNVAGMKSAQDELAAALPEFAPYANLEMSDVTDCRERGDSGARQAGRAVGASLGRLARGAGNAAEDTGNAPPAAATSDESGINEAAEADAAAESATR